MREILIVVALLLGALVHAPRAHALPADTHSGRSSTASEEQWLVDAVTQDHDSISS